MWLSAIVELGVQGCKEGLDPSSEALWNARDDTIQLVAQIDVVLEGGPGQRVALAQRCNSPDPALEELGQAVARNKAPLLAKRFQSAIQTLALDFADRCRCSHARSMIAKGAANTCLGTLSGGHAALQVANEPELDGIEPFFHQSARDPAEN